MLNAFHDRQPAAANLIFPHAGVPLHAMLTSTGYESAVPGRYDFSGLHRGQSPLVLFQYTLSGCGKLRFERKHYELIPGDAMLLTFPHDNRYWLPAGGNWTFFYLCLHGSAVVECFRSLIASCGPVIHLPRESPVVSAVADLCCQILDGKITSPWNASAEAYRVTMLIMDRCFPQLAESPDGRKLPDSIRRAVSFIRANLRQSPDVSSIAASSGLSRYHFSREFRRHVRLSPGEFLQREKLKAAIDILRSGNAPLAEIAPQCGFSDPNYLIRAFRKVYGITPTQFRKRITLRSSDQNS